MFEWLCGGIAALVLGSLLLVWRFRTEGKTLQAKAKKVVQAKTPIIDENYIEASRKLTEKITVGVLETLGIRRILPTEELVKLRHLTDKERREISGRVAEEYREEFVRISRVKVLLDNFPKEFEEIIDRITISLISGFFGSVLLFIYGYLRITPMGLTEQTLFVLGLATLILLLYYFNFGIYQIRPIRQLEKQLEEIEECKDLDKLDKCL